MRALNFVLGILLATAGCQSGDKGDPGAGGTNGTNGTNGTSAAATGAIHGTVKDAANQPVAGIRVATTPESEVATTDASGAFALDAIPIGAYSVTATGASYNPFTLANVGVASGVTTNVSLVVQLMSNAPGLITGRVTDSKSPAGPLAGVVVAVEGQPTLTATTDAQGAFSLASVPAGPVFLTATAPNDKYLDTDTRQAVMLPPAGTVRDVTLVLSARPSDAASYVGGENACIACHKEHYDSVAGSAHKRSLVRIPRDVLGKAMPGAFVRLLNPILTTPRTVMTPLAGTISASITSTSVTGVSTAFQSDAANAIQPGDKVGYTPKGLGWTAIGTVATVNSDTTLTLAAPPTFAQGVPSISGAKFSVARLSRTGYAHMMPEDANDIVAPAWPGVKATNPNYDPNDPLIYASTGAYADGQVFVYLCNLKDGVIYLNDEYVQKFGGNPYTCKDGSFYDPVNNPNPAVPLVRIDVIYGGMGDKDVNGAPHPNMGVFKQRFQGHIADVKAASTWSPAYASIADRDRDSLTLPIQILESGDKVNGGFKMNGYHPTEQKFPGESWSQRSRTFSHACAGCHNTGLSIEWDMTTVNLAVPRDGATTMTQAAVKKYSFVDENITCEHCHGPGSEHVSSAGGKGNAIINPAYVTAEKERQLCGKCHGYDDAQNKAPEQTYGFEYPWSTTNPKKVGGGNYVPGVHELKDFIGNWDERTKDEEAFWDPSLTGGKLYGQAHRQQYVMLSFAKHANNAYEKITCTSCHSSHSTFLSSPTVTAGADHYTLADAGFKDNVSCLGCHAGFGPFASVGKGDVAAVHLSGGGSASKNGAALTLTTEDTATSLGVVSAAVSKHMGDKLGMSTVAYTPTNDAMPLGRCTTCHMPKVAKSGGYVTGVDFLGNEALVEGDQASHVFDVIWPYQSLARSVGGPTASSAAYGTKTVINPDNTTATTYNKFGYMPNSCSKCHADSRRASDLVSQ